MSTLSPQEEEVLTKFKQQQQQQPRLTPAEEVRSLLEQSTGYGVLSANSAQMPGFPVGKRSIFVISGGLTRNYTIMISYHLGMCHTAYLQLLYLNI